MIITSTAIVQWLTASMGAWAFLVPMVTQSATAQVACRYTISQIIHAPACQPSGSYPPISATGISPNGRYISGHYPPCAFGNERALVYDTQLQQLTVIPHPPGISISYAHDVNDNGLVAGTWGGSAGSFGFIYSVADGQYTQLPPIDPLGTCGVSAINNAQVVCGYRSIGSPGNPTSPQTAFVWSATMGFQDIGILVDPGSTPWDINSAGVAVGRAGILASASERGFIFANGKTTVLPPIDGGISSAVVRINDAGMMVVTGLVETAQSTFARAFLVDAGGWHPLPPLPGTPSPGIWGLGHEGTAVGRCANPYPPYIRRACIWRDGHAVELTTLLPPVNGLSLESANGMTHDGVMVVEGYLFLDATLFVLSPVWSQMGDTDCNGMVNMDDLLAIILHWGPCGGCSADMTRDGEVNMADLIVVIENWDFQ